LTRLAVASEFDHKIQRLSIFFFEDSAPHKIMRFYEFCKRLKHIGLVDAAKDVYKRDGFPGFFKGMSWRGARVATALPIILYGTEVLKEHFNNVNTKP